MHSSRRAPEWVAPCQAGLGLPQCSLGKGCLETSFLKSKSHLEHAGPGDPAWAAQGSRDLRPPLSLAPENPVPSPASCLPAGLLCSAPGHAPEPLDAAQATPSTAPECVGETSLVTALSWTRPFWCSCPVWGKGQACELGVQALACGVRHPPVLPLTAALAQGQPLPQEEHGAWLRATGPDHRADFNPGLWRVGRLPGA